MALLIPIAVVAYSYYIQNNDYGDPDFELEGKTAVELLGSERDGMVVDFPISSVSFFDGNPKQAAEALQKRVNDLLTLNPWLSGRLHMQDKQLKLWYDETGKDRAPNIFRIAGNDVVLSRETPYSEYFWILSSVIVPLLKDTVGKNVPVLMVTVVPDSVKPTSRFALVVSMSRVVGDMHSFYLLSDLLSPDKPLRKLNPSRNQDFDSAAAATMGQEEASYLKNVVSNPLWSLLKTEQPDSHLFYVSQEWIEQQEFLLKFRTRNTWQTWLNGAKQRARDRSSQCCWGIWPDSFNQSSSSVEELHQEEHASDVHPSTFEAHEIVVSWFWRTLGVHVGLILSNMRSSLSILDENDIGNYTTAIPCTAKDYQTPDKVHQSLRFSRRFGARRFSMIAHHNRLPELKWDTTFSITNDPRVEAPEITGIGSEVMHMPLFDTKMVTALPNSLSVFFLFRAGPQGKIGAFVVATPSVHQIIESSGIVEETIVKF